MPLYQPATIMFRSAIHKFHKLAIKKTTKDGNEVQVNGLILDSEGAVFLAKFVLSLGNYYQNEMKMKRVHLSEFNIECFCNALNKALKDFAWENM